MTDDNELSGLVHDLMNALTQILTTAELVETQGEPCGQLADDARTIRRAALEARDLTEAIRARALCTGNDDRRSDDG